jgi:hypothetical protein
VLGLAVLVIVIGFAVVLLVVAPLVGLVAGLFAITESTGRRSRSASSRACSASSL